MDGALRPNSLLEEATVIARAPEPDNLTPAGDELLFSSAGAVLALDPRTGRSEERHQFDQPVTALAWSQGVLAVGVPGAIKLVGGAYDGRSLDRLGDLAALCPTALAFESPGVLLACLGSQANPPSEWKRDLLQCNSSGSVCRVNLGTNAVELLATGLAYPYGVAPRPSGIWVAESWRHRIIALRAGASPRPVFGHLPAYPSRLAPAADGGVWLSLFAPRRQMIEFVLREHGYRERMMAEVDPEYWMAPALATGKSFLEPIHGGQVKHLGIVKPWGPTRSYGLVVKLDSSGIPTVSLHSRADGKRHGVTSCLELGERLLVASKGGGVLIGVDVANLDME
jgi:hypothetical protein